MISLSDQIVLIIAPASAFLITLFFVPRVRRLATRWGCVAVPKTERWHTEPTPNLGGLAFFAGFVITVLLLTPGFRSIWPFFLIVTQMFIIGIYDDFRQINPATKLIGQIIAAATAIFFGYALGFFHWSPLDALLTALWIIGLTNAINLLDNMDGLAGGIGLIAAAYLAFLFIQQGSSENAIMSLALVGALAGFLVYNSYPASIFMGDAGSLFLGSALSLLTIGANGQASNILSLVAVPSFILLVPILDTALVTITRLLRGQPVSQGGKDHASHRLVILGLKEPQAVRLLYLVAIVAGGTAVLIKWFSYSLSFAVLPLVLLLFTLFTAYLAQVEVVSLEEERRKRAEKPLTVLLTRLTYKRRLLEVLLDLVVIASAFYLAFALHFQFRLSDSLVGLYLQSLPLIIVATYLAFFLCGIYRGIWRYTGLEDLVRITKGVVFGTLLSIVSLMLFYPSTDFWKIVVVVYSLLLLFGMAGSRVSFRLFGLLFAGNRKEKVPVLIYGAGDGGEAVVRECRRNSGLAYRPIGFLDDDPQKEGRTVLGLRVFGAANRLPEILKHEKVAGCIISSSSILANGHAEQIRSICHEQGLWMKRLRLEFTEDSP